jgi:hypothetical protein
VAAAGANGYPNANFVRALCHCVRDHPVGPDRREKDSEASEGRQK